MRDLDIRLALRQELKILHAPEFDTLILDEVGLCLGAARVDLAVVNGQLIGYEIKSDQDTLERLAGQQEVYSKVFDRVILIVGPKHAEKIVERVPSWWGVSRVVTEDGEIRFRIVQKPQDNPQLDPFALAQLLWRDELIEALKETGLEQGFLSKPRRILCERLAQTLPLCGLRNLVTRSLKARANWRSAP